MAIRKGFGSEGGVEEDEQKAEESCETEEAEQSDGCHFYFSAIALGVFYWLIISH